MPIRLVALAGGADILVDRALVLVGRHPLCDVRLDSRRVSRFHCGLYRDHDEIIVRDLGSSNGTLFNGIPRLRSVGSKPATSYRLPSFVFALKPTHLQ